MKQSEARFMASINLKPEEGIYYPFGSSSINVLAQTLLSVFQPVRFVYITFDENMMKQSTNDLTQIPGVGENIARDLLSIGILEIRNLIDRDPEDLYLHLCDVKRTKIDRCVLYVFRCAVYYATVTPHEPELLKWWNWKDE